MKKKLLSMFLLLTLLFTAACNKEKTAEPTPTTAPTATEIPTATPTPSPSPTPVPENLAMAALESLSDSLEYLVEYTPEETVDYSNGIGMDLAMDFTVNSDILQLIGLADLESIHLDGSYDIKDIMAANFTFFLGETELLNFNMFTDMNNVLFNLPKYSDQYAGFSFEELANSTSEEIEWEEGETPSASGLFSDDAYQVIRTNTTIDSANIPTSEDMTELIYVYVKRFVDCFQPQEISEENVSIGTGNYTMTGKKYTVSASATDLQAVIDAMAADPTMPAELAQELDALLLDGFNSFVMNYYVNEEGSFAWEVYPDTEADQPAVLVSVPTGFCLYSTAEDGTENIILYSVTTGEGAGTITIPTTEEGVSDISVEYNFTDENNGSIHVMADAMELTMNVSKNGDIMQYDYTFVADGSSILMKATVTPQKEADLTVDIASYGMLIASVELNATFRDYNEIPVPQDYVDLDTWTANLDTEAFNADLEQLMEDYPALADLFLGSEEEEEMEPYIPDENYSDAFMNMTGYYMDEYGYVYFEPSEEEVLAIGEPSTAYARYPLSAETRQQLLDLGAKNFPAFAPEVYTSYIISGSAEYNNVTSDYTEEYIYLLDESWEVYYDLVFDAVSQELIGITISHKTEEEALALINEALTILGVEAVTPEEPEFEAVAGNFYVYGYELYEGCYIVSLLVNTVE